MMKMKFSYILLLLVSLCSCHYICEPEIPFPSKTRFDKDPEAKRKFLEAFKEGYLIGRKGTREWEIGDRTGKRTSNWLGLVRGYEKGFRDYLELPDDFEEKLVSKCLFQYKGIEIRQGETLEEVNRKLGKPANIFLCELAKGVHLPKPGMLKEDELYITAIYYYIEGYQLFFFYLDGHAYRRYMKEDVDNSALYLIEMEIYPQGAIF